MSAQTVSINLTDAESVQVALLAHAFVNIAHVLLGATPVAYDSPLTFLQRNRPLLERFDKVFTHVRDVPPLQVLNLLATKNFADVAQVISTSRLCSATAVGLMNFVIGGMRGMLQRLTSPPPMPPTPPPPKDPSSGGPTRH